MPIKKESVRERGFTLLEVIIAISIFAVGVLAVATMQISATRGNRLGNELTQATTLAQMQIEELKGHLGALERVRRPHADPPWTAHWKLQ